MQVPACGEDTPNGGKGKIKNEARVKFFTVSELARKFEKSENSVRNYERQGKLRAIKVGNGMRLFSEEAVADFRKTMPSTSRRRNSARGTE